jgi:lipoprotein-anchoring transpeptidase ErfK/SrfK
MRRALVIGLLLAAALPARAAGGGLDELFARADDDPAAVAPLIIAVSERIAAAPADEGAALAARAAPFCRRAFFSPERLPGMDALGLQLHRVAAGETPVAIARRYHTTADLLGRLNAGFTPKALRVGQRLKVFDLAAAPLELVVGRAQFRLLVWRGAVLIGSYPVGLGAAGHPTPLGDTTVAMCVRDPEWRDPDTGRIYKPGDPGNVLGGYWIGFAHGGAGTFRGIGIHGYTAERAAAWLGKPGSHGCVRMLQADVAAVFALVRPGVRVSIRP